jgi:hypothetical protein
MFSPLALAWILRFLKWPLFSDYPSNSLSLLQGPVQGFLLGKSNPQESYAFGVMQEKDCLTWCQNLMKSERKGISP